MLLQGKPYAGVEHELIRLRVDIPPVYLHDAQQLVIYGEGYYTVVGHRYLPVQIALVYFRLGTAASIIRDHRSPRNGFPYFRIDTFYLLVIYLIGVTSREGLDINGRTLRQYGLRGLSECGKHVVYLFYVLG